MLIQRRGRRTERLCPQEAGRINGSGLRRRRVREDVRVKEKWLNPRGGERCGCREANIKLRSTDDRRMSRMLISTRRNQRNRADVLIAIRVTVNAFVQLRRDADEKCPGKRCKQNGRSKDMRTSL